MVKRSSIVSKVLSRSYFVFWFLVLFTEPVHAYLDPSVMTYAIQAFAGIAITLGTVFGLYWRRLRNALNAGRKNNYQNWETDNLSFYDPHGQVTYHALNRDTAKKEKELKNQEQKESRKTLKDHIREMTPSFVLVIVFSFLLFIFAPLESYFNNMSDFWFDFHVLFPQILKMFLISCGAGILLFIIAYLLLKEFFHVLYVLGFIALFSTYIEGNFFVKYLPVLEGDTIMWGEYHPQMLMSLMLWIGITLLVVILIRILKYQNFYKVSKVISTILCLVLLTTVITVGIQNKGFEHKVYRVSTKEDEFTMSKDKNFIILLIDATDSTRFSEMLKDHPEWKETLQDFTYFSDMASAYPFTGNSVPYLITGQAWLGQDKYSSFWIRAYDESPILKSLEDSNYKLGYYDDWNIYNSDNVYRFSNFKSDVGSISSFQAFAYQECKLIWFKYAPYFLKPLVNLEMEKYKDLRVASEDAVPFVWTDEDFYRDVKETEITYTDEKLFKFIHTEGAHPPWNYDKDVNVIGQWDGSYSQNLEATMTMVTAYLEKLRRADAYDNSVIIIMADHGWPYKTGGKNHLERFDPVFMAKGIGEKHEMYSDDAPLSFEDLQEAYQRLLNGAPSSEIFDYKEGDSRTRKVYFYKTKENTITEYSIEGKARDEDELTPTGKTYKKKF